MKETNKNKVQKEVDATKADNTLTTDASINKEFSSKLENDSNNSSDMHSEVYNSDNNSNKIGYIGGLALIILIVLGYFFFFNNSGTPPVETENVKVRLGWVHQAQFAGFYVAKEKGYYSDLGLNVELLELDQTIDQVQELSGDSINISVMEAHQVLVGLDSNSEIKAVMAVYQINPHVLAVREDSDIYGPEDFNGKVVGLAGGEGEGSALFQIFIEKFGKTDSVTYKNLGFDTVGDFINKNADIIDLYQTDQPFLAKKLGVPLRMISLDAYGFSTYGDVVVVKSDYVDNNKDTVQKFVDATRKGWEYAITHQEETVAIVLPYTSGSYSDAEYQKHIIQQSTPLIRGTQNDLGRMEFVSWSTLYESMKSAGVISKDLDIRNVYTNEFIK